MAAIINLTQGSEVINISSETLLMIEDLGTERKVYYDTGGVDAETFIAEETLGDIITQAGNAIQVSVGTALDFVLVGLNAAKVFALAEEGSGAKVYYSGKGADLDQFVTVETPAFIEGIIEGL
jgi:hypothetical protein